MELAISHPGFEGQQLVVKTPGFFRGAQLLLNGTPVKRQKGVYTVKNNSGADVPVKLRALFDPIPKVTIGEDVVQLARPLTWYEYAWMGLPIVLVFFGGALGGGIGAFAFYTSCKIFRSAQSNFAKYGLTGLVSVGAVAIFLVLAIAIQTLIYVGKQS